jgi:DNA-binding GntR family transcriptional regulator
MRDAILTLQFKPGQKLTERELCESTGVGRGLMREVLRHLETEGLIVSILHKGPTVVELDLADAIEIYELRSALEPLMARLFVARATASDIDRLKDLSERFCHAAQVGDADQVGNAHREFYNTLYVVSGNKMAAEIARTLNNRMTLLRAMTFAEQTAAERRASITKNRAITACLARRDADGAANACVDQVARSRAAAERVLGARRAG